MAAFIKINILILIGFTLIAQTCENDADKDVNQKEKAKVESLEVQTVAAAKGWRKFMSTAESQVSIANTQLKTLHSRIIKMDGGEKAFLQNEYNRNSKLLNNLKVELEKQHSSQPATEDYNADKLAKNNSFKAFFLHEILQINNDLEHLLE